MKILREQCPSCGGKVRVGTDSITCLSCDFSKEGLSGSVVKALYTQCEDFNPTITLAKAGQWLVRSSLQEWLDCKRHAQNLTEGYELRAVDKLTLIESGFGMRTVEEKKE